MSDETISLRPQKTFSNTGVHSTSPQSGRSLEGNESSLEEEWHDHRVRSAPTYWMEDEIS